MIHEIKTASGAFLDQTIQQPGVARMNIKLPFWQRLKELALNKRRMTTYGYLLPRGYREESDSELKKRITERLNLNHGA